MLNPMLESLYFKIISSIFPSIVDTKSVNTRLCLIFNPYMNYFKCFKFLRFIFQQINPTYHGVITNKIHGIFITKEYATDMGPKYHGVYLLPKNIFLHDLEAES
jgi:hypothetical protein